MVYMIATFLVMLLVRLLGLTVELELELFLIDTNGERLRWNCGVLLTLIPATSG